MVAATRAKVPVTTKERRGLSNGDALCPKCQGATQQHFRTLRTQHGEGGAVGESDGVGSCRLSCACLSKCTRTMWHRATRIAPLSDADAHAHSFHLFSMIATPLSAPPSEFRWLQTNALERAATEPAPQRTRIADQGFTRLRVLN